MSNVLSDISESLSYSISKNWKVGDLNDWFNYANTMKDTINAIVPILKRESLELDDYKNRISELENIIREKDNLIALMISKKFE